MPAPNPYSVSPSINLVNRSVLVSKQWFDRANLGEAFTSEECSIIERENFIGIVQQVHLEDGALRVKFGSAPYCVPHASCISRCVTISTMFTFPWCQILYRCRDQIRIHYQKHVKYAHNILALTRRRRHSTDKRKKE